MAFLSHAAKMAEYANLAYEERITIECALAGTPHRFFTQNGTQAFCFVKDGVATVAFRGTEKNVDDWRTDLRFRKIRYQRGKVHEGFYSAMTMIAGEIQGWAIRQGAEQWYITGHSLGAALAALFADHLDTRRVLGVYLFGCPRIGTSAFTHWYNKRLGDRTLRVVNNNDIVASIPPWVLGYRHLGEVVRYFDADEEIHATRSWLQTIWHAVEGCVRDFMKWGVDGIKDHSMDTYQRLAAKHLGDSPH